MSSVKSLKAVALVSSGLDSLLAAKIVKDLGVDVQGVFFLHRFDCLDIEEKQRELRAAFDPRSIPVTIVDLSEKMLPIIRHPEHGHGAGMNPCIDCHLLMFREAHRIMIEIGARFLVSGEVVGQRPMSQMKPMLFHIDKVSGLKGLILRPLSAKILPATIPETEGWVDREKLYDISGRSRKIQLSLARQWGIEGYKAPAGGCVLTEPNYSRRVKSFIAHRGKEALTLEMLQLLRYGRHFWPREDVQIIVGRDEADNKALESFKENRWSFLPAETKKGPLVLGQGLQSESDIRIAASIAARYTTEKTRGKVLIRFEKDGTGDTISSAPIEEERLVKWRV